MHNPCKLKSHKVKEKNPPLGPSYTIPDSHRSDIKFYRFEVNLALKIMII
jgi:hypothetical protein